MQKVNWLVVGISIIIVILLLSGGGMMMGGWGYRGWDMMGPGMMGNGGYPPFAWIGMIFRWLVPLGLIALAVFGIVWLVRNTGKPKPPSS